MIPQRGRFLVDVNVGGMVATALRLTGHDVVFVGDLDPKMPDVAILTLATRERRIIITTLDNDFGELVYRSGQPHYGVLLLRMPDATAAEKTQVAEEIVSRFGSQLPRSFSVYRSGRLRIRG